MARFLKIETEKLINVCRIIRIESLIIYENTKHGFCTDVDGGIIARRIEEQFKYLSETLEIDIVKK